MDVGLLGPGTVTWQLHADPAMWVAGIASLYLQALHPRAVAAVVQNSNFQEDPLGRLLRTANFVGTVSYGSTEEVEHAAARVRRVHRTLRGKDATGKTFRIDDPELLLWVHCAEVHCFLTVLRRAGYRLTDAQADRYYDEQRRTAALVGLNEDEVPGSTRGMADYFAATLPELKRTADSEVVYRFLHRPPVDGVLRLGLDAYEPLLGHLAYSVQPQWAIALHGHRPYPEPAATALLRAVRTAALLVPAPIRWGVVPDGHVNKAIRRLGLRVAPRRSLLPS
ncbi:oxygenase MpaB family protein [Saccharothrix deserti]|uniref:oxygenase MpaB family protein n=1 Tax=Saccharothrix deserti TaxID=2593674 RepID=UPI00131E635B|nr:oxygenase MpaB family protein [Saccharothrix deserti]